jgi:hypothetical protein
MVVLRRHGAALLLKQTEPQWRLHSQLIEAERMSAIGHDGMLTIPRYAPFARGDLRER